MKVGLISLGCAKNLVDSEMILSFLDRNEFEIVTDANSADIIFINTCGFIEASKQESINTILEFIPQNKIIVVTGCLVERYLEDLEKELPEVDLFLPIREYPNMALRLQEVIKNKSLNGHLDLSKRIISTRPFSAYLKISEGCSNCCTYCAIPLIRGSFHSFDKQEVINQALALKEKGVKELVVISQDTTKYGSDIKEYKTDIVDLLKSLLEIKEFEYIRLLYLYPELVTDKLIDFIANNDKVMPYFDIPLQHSEDKMLKLMNRRGNKEFITKLLEKIRARIPEAILRTTMIVGFPGETEEDFDNLLNFIKEQKFDRLGAFSYSPEEGTKGYEMDNQIEEAIKEKRLEALYLVQDDIALAQNERHLGKVMDVLITEYDAENYCYLGRSYAFAPDDIDGNIACYALRELTIGEVVKVKILDASINGLSGSVEE